MESVRKKTFKNYPLSENFEQCIFKIHDNFQTQFSEMKTEFFFVSNFTIIFFQKKINHKKNNFKL